MLLKVTLAIVCINKEILASKGLKGIWYRKICDNHYNGLFDGVHAFKQRALRNGNIWSENMTLDIEWNITNGHQLAKQSFTKFSTSSASPKKITIAVVNRIVSPTLPGRVTSIKSGHKIETYFLYIIVKLHQVAVRNSIIIFKLKILFLTLNHYNKSLFTVYHSCIRLQMARSSSDPSKFHRRASFINLYQITAAWQKDTLQDM